MDKSENKLIVNDNNDHHNVFFTNRKIFYFSSLFIVSIGLLALTIVFVLNIDLANLWRNLIKGISLNSYQWIFLVLQMLFPFFRAATSICFFYFSLKKYNLKASLWEWTYLSFGLIFIISITPSSIGSEPFIIFWLNRKIKNLQKSSSIVLASSFLGQSAAMAVTWPSFLWYCSTIDVWNLSQDNKVAFWFLVIGMIMDLFVLCTFFVLIFTKQTHYWMSILFHFFKKMLKMKYKSKSEIREEIVVKSSFKNEVLSQLKDIKISTITFFNFFIYNFLYYTIIYFSMALINGTNDLVFLQIFNYTNIATTANNFIPLPGSEGTLQLLLKILLTNTNTPVSIINDSIFVWRFFTSQLPALFGLVVFVVNFSIIIYRKRADKRKRISEHDMRKI